MKRLKLNTVQLSLLRTACKHEFGQIVPGDRCTHKALVARGFAFELSQIGLFYINDAGRERAKLAADEWAKTTYEGPRDESLMQDLPTEATV